MCGSMWRCAGTRYHLEIKKKKDVKREKIILDKQINSAFSTPEGILKKSNSQKQ